MSRKLKIKIKSLAVESIIIRKEERKVRGSRNWLKKRDDTFLANTPSPEYTSAWGLHYDLHHHRTVHVRHEARAAQIAYGYLRGREFRQIENGNIYNAPDWGRVIILISKYYEGHSASSMLTESVRLWVRRAGLPENLRPKWA